MLALVAITVALSQLKPAAPTIEGATLLPDVVKRSQLLRQVRGNGTLVPDEIRWVAARTSGRVDKIVLRPGAPVTPDSVILHLSNPEVLQAAANADSELRAAEAELVNLEVSLQSGVLQAESTAAAAKADYDQTRLRSEVDAQLFKEGLISKLDYDLSKVRAEQAETKHTIEQKRFKFSQEMVGPQLAVKKAAVERLRALAQLRRDELDALAVRAGMNGVLQIVPVEVGSQVSPGTNLARVADPTRLKAEVKISETQARDIQLDQVAMIDTRNGIIPGKVSRIDPSVQNGSVTVDVILTGQLPRGARPDLSVEGTIELERLEDVVNVGRPIFGTENGTVTIFRYEEDGVHARRTKVRFGRNSVNAIEVLEGLVPGDKVILSDMSQWDGIDRVRIK